MSARRTGEPPTNGEARTAPASAPSPKIDNQQSDCAALAAAPQDAEAHRAAVAAADERFARVRRALAERGFDLIVSSNAGGALFIVARWGMSRDFGDLDHVEAFARQVGAPC